MSDLAPHSCHDRLHSPKNAKPLIQCAKHEVAVDCSEPLVWQLWGAHGLSVTHKSSETNARTCQHDLYTPGLSHAVMSLEFFTRAIFWMQYISKCDVDKQVIKSHRHSWEQRLLQHDGPRVHRFSLKGFWNPVYHIRRKSHCVHAHAFCVWDFYYERHIVAVYLGKDVS